MHVMARGSVCESSCFASAFTPSKPSILCSAFLLFPTVSGNLLLARSKPRRYNYIGFWYGKSTAGTRDNLVAWVPATIRICESYHSISN